jgi:hypothetical protein
MSFPSNPTNGQTAVVNGVTYTYSTSNSSWVRSTINYASASTLTVTGTSTANSFITTYGGQVTGYHTGPIGANTPNTVVATSVTTTSAGQITGYHTGAIGANTANSGVFTSVTTTSGGQLSGYLTGAIGANTANTGAFTTVTATGTSSTIASILTNAAEPATVSATAATGTINFDITTQSILYYTSNASANWTVNFRGSSGTSLNTLMTTGQVITAVFLVTQGSTAYYNSAVTIDGNSVTPKYQGGTAWSAGNASGIDVYTYTIVKTGSAAFTVLASQTKFT